MRPPLAIIVLLALVAALWASPYAVGQSGGTRTATTAPTTTGTAPADSESLPIPEGSASPVSVDSGLGGTALRLLIGLIVVVGLIAAVWQVMKRVQRNRYPALEAAGGSLIDVVATTPLGPNRALHLVRVADEVVLVGATEQMVQAVARLSADDAAAIVRALSTEAGDTALGRPADPARSPGGPFTLVDRLRDLTVRR